jgi:GT2 family glycosyltransferase
LAFTDDDCIPSAEWLAALARTAEKAEVEALEGKVISEPSPAHAWEEAPVNPSGGLFWSCNVAVRRDTFLALGGFDENYTEAAMEDVDLRVALENAHKRIAFVPEAVVNHPARRTTLRSKLRHIRRFYAQVYFHRKWSGTPPVRLFALMVAAVTKFWLYGPVRQGRGIGTAIFLYVLAMAGLFIGFLPWYRRAGRAVAESARR